MPDQTKTSEPVVATADDSAKVSKFVEAITADANEKRKEIEQQTNDYIATELEKAKQKALEDSYAYIQRKVSSIRNEIGENLSREELKSRKELYQRRGEMTDDVMKAAADQLTAFTSTPEYTNFLNKWVGEIVDTFESDFSLFLCERDMRFADGLKSRFPVKDVSVKPDIVIGGAYAVKGSLAADNTLDQKLAAQLEWFEENSGLAF